LGFGLKREIKEKAPHRSEPFDRGRTKRGYKKVFAQGDLKNWGEGEGSPQCQKGRGWGGSESRRRAIVRERKK